MPWAGPVATKLYHTSAAGAPPLKLQFTVGGSDCEAAATVPLVGVQVAATGSTTAAAHSSLAGGTGPGLMHSVNVALSGDGC